MGSPWDAVTGFFGMPLREVPLGAAILIALLLIALAVHWNNSSR
jgi:hypothetical protein